MMHRRCFLAAAAAAAALPAGAGARENATAKLYAEAKKEGQVTWWTAHYAEGAAERVRAAFKAKYPGIEVQFIRQMAQVIYSRLTQDLTAGVHQLDVFASTDEAHYPMLKRQNALAQFVPPEIGALPRALRLMDEDNTYQAGALRFVTLIYNPAKVTPAPRRWADLLDPKFKGQVTVGHPGFSGVVGGWAVAMNDKFGWDYFKKLALNSPKIGRSVNDTVTDVVAGERSIGAGPDAYALQRKAAGSAIDIAFPEDDAILIVSPVAVMKDAPHPNAARLFMNFYYSREYSQAMHQSFNFPLRADMHGANGLTAGRVRAYRNKVERLASGIPEVTAKWRELFGEAPPRTSTP